MNSHHTINKTQSIYQNLGANEKAIIDKVNTPWLRVILIRFVHIKMRLQFTGWLQYLILTPITLLLFLIVGLIYIVGLYLPIFEQLANALIFIPLLILSIILFDIITCRFRIRLPEPIPKSRSDDSVFKIMRERKSCRSYQSKRLIPEHLSALKQSISTHLNTPKFSDAPIRLEWVEARINVWPVVNAQQFIVAIAPKQYNRSAIFDIGKSLQNIVINATKMGLGTCWIGPGADHTSVKAHLGARFNDEQDAVICLCAVGYKSVYAPLFIRIFNSRFHNRLDTSDLFFSDPQMNTPIDTTQHPWSDFEPCFESCRWAPSSYNGQTTRAVLSEPDPKNNKNMQIDFYASTSSRYYAVIAIGIWCGNWEISCDALNVKGHFELASHSSKACLVSDIYTPQSDISWVMDLESAIEKRDS